MAERKGTRCAVCVGCGRCFEVPDEPEEPQKGWSGKRCAVCVGCGECARAWGLAPGDGDDADAVSGATNWADAFKVMDAGGAGEAPPIGALPGVPAEEAPARAAGAHPGSSAVGEDASGEGLRAGCSGDADAVTGATPGVASACKELGLDDMASLGASLGIKPPGVA